MTSVVLKFLLSSTVYVVEWLEWLGRRKVVRLRHPTTGKVSVNQAVSGYQGRIGQRKERDGLRLSSAVPKIQWVSNPHSPHGY